MRYRFAVIGLGVAGMLLGADEARQKIQVAKTEQMEFPANGTLRVEHSTGELTVEGWDHANVEITTVKSTKLEWPPQDRDKKLQELDRVRITGKRQGNELVVTTEYPRHRAFPFVDSLSTVTNFDLDYRIKVPRNAKVIVKHDDGEVHIDDVAGNIDAKARQGLIALRLSGDDPRSIDAKSDLGSVNSDFPGSETRNPWPFGHKFVEGISGPSQSLHLHIGYGDIVILKAHNPQEPAPMVAK